jgi:hypothetical protein
MAPRFFKGLRWAVARHISMAAMSSANLLRPETASTLLTRYGRFGARPQAGSPVGARAAQFSDPALHVISARPEQVSNKTSASK